MSTITAMEELEKAQLGPDEGIMSCLDHTGDYEVTWNRRKAVEVELARTTFDKLKRDGYTAYKVKSDGETRGVAIEAFDPGVERMVMVPPLAGG